MDATQTAQILVALFLPLGDQVLVCIAFLYTVLIQLCQDAQHKETRVVLIFRLRLNNDFTYEKKRVYKIVKETSRAKLAYLC